MRQRGRQAEAGFITFFYNIFAKEPFLVGGAEGLLPRSFPSSERFPTSCSTAGTPVRRCAKLLIHTRSWGIRQSAASRPLHLQGSSGPSVNPCMHCILKDSDLDCAL
jgi:hypothetical protein